MKERVCVLVLKSSKKYDITNFLVEKITASLDNILVFCDEKLSKYSYNTLEIVLNLKRNRIEVYKTSEVRPDQTYSSTTKISWVDKVFHNKRASVSDYIILSGGFLPENLDIFSYDRILPLREYVSYFIKEKVLAEIALRGSKYYFYESKTTGSFFDLYCKNYFYIASLFFEYGEIPQEFHFVLGDMFGGETKSGYYKLLNLYKKSIKTWDDVQLKIETFYYLLIDLTKQSSRRALSLTNEFVKIAADFTEEEKSILFNLTLESVVSISSYDDEDIYSSVASTYNINYKLWYNIENICGKKLSSLLPESLQSKLLNFNSLSDFSKYKNSFPVYFSLDENSKEIQKAIDSYQRKLIEDSCKKEDIIAEKVLAVVYRYSINLKLTKILTSTDFSKNKLKFNNLSSFYDTYFKFLIEYFGKELNPMSVSITVSSGNINIHSIKNALLFNFLKYFSSIKNVIVESVGIGYANPETKDKYNKILSSKYNRNKNITISNCLMPSSPFDIEIEKLIQ